MRISLAANSGFCFGVRRAIQMALAACKDQQQVYTLGELIHNPQYVEELEDLGIKVRHDAADISDSIVVIRSHGITKQELETLKQQHNTIIDATCPYVNRTHEIIQSAIKEDYQVLILGDVSHPEVIGMLSYGNDSTRVVAPGEIPPDINTKRICLISQTTQKIENLNKLVCDILPHVLELKVYNSICLATTQRQNASAVLARNSDLMIVIGGRQSSNTKMLASLCAKYCQTLHIETEDELKAEHVSKVERIGLAAGASTPEQRILKVYNKILKINGEGNLATSIQSIPLFKEESC
jgi:(E)-4-hydroxy-3-methyl-but-2-enyl pyrophosphate reductase